jgi:hypothetical protein
MRQSIEVVFLWKHDQYEVRMPEVPRVGDKIVHHDGTRGIVVDVEWSISDPPRELTNVGVVVDEVPSPATPASARTT